MTETTTDPARAAAILAQGGIVALPTETVYGLAARWDRAVGIERIFAAKGRPSDNPLIVHLAQLRDLDPIALRIPPAAATLLSHFAPGPLTVTLPRRPEVSDRITAGLPTVAVRIPAAPLFQEVLRIVGVPLVAPSANRSGRPSPTTWQAVLEELHGKIDAVLVGPPCAIGIESTVVDCCSSPPRLLRPGGITLEQLCEVLPGIVPATAAGAAAATCTAAGAAEQSPLEHLPSPGMRHRHYAPSVRVELVDDPHPLTPSPLAMYLGITPHGKPAEWGMHCCYSDIASYAHALFAAFREGEQRGFRTIYCQRVPKTGLGRGLMDRLERAALGSAAKDSC